MMMRTSQRVGTLWLAILLSAAVPFAGCGRKESAPLSEGGENSAAAPGAKPAEATLEEQTEQKLDPLTSEDVELYLKVMRTAAERVKNPAPGDKAALEGAKKIIAGGALGRVPTQDDAKTLERANLVALSMDEIVADDMKLDGRTYRGIAEAVESALQYPGRAAPTGKDGQPLPDLTPTPLQDRLSSVNAANERFLAPYRSEIEKLLPVVRNPATLPN
jgi:hypothetical protein